MIFLTVGTVYPFDRLVKMVDKAVAEGAIEEDVFAQIGLNGYEPKHMEYCRVMDKIEFEEVITRSSALLCHAGIGSIVMGLRYNKPVLVLPRLAKYGEHVNNHQVDTAIEFEKSGHVLTIMPGDDLSLKMQKLSNFIPRPRSTQADNVSARIKRFIEAEQARKNRN